MRPLLALENGLDTLSSFVQHGFYVHVVHALLQAATGYTFMSAVLSIKLYSVNYFYWHGHLYTYLPRHNWVKQFIRLTDTGHLASFALLLGPLVADDFVQRFWPLAHNVHFIIMMAYWIATIGLGMQDSDRRLAPGVHEWHMDSSPPPKVEGGNADRDALCLYQDLLSYVHHTVPYCLLYLFPTPSDCAHAYNSTTLLSTYGWLYVWFLGIYWPWRFLTGDTVYSILDTKKTHLSVILGFIGFMHILAWVSNTTGYAMCRLLT